METNTFNNIISFLKRELYNNVEKSILPVSSTNDTSRCYDFDLNNKNCLSKPKNKSKKINIAAIHPILEKEDFVAITIIEYKNNIDYCDMV
jgi:hypothetical protein